MKDILDAAQAEIATLQRLVVPPTGDLGFGTDLSCTDDLQDDFGEVEGALVVLQSIYRELITPPGGPQVPGSLPDDTEYGLGLSQYVQREMTPAQLLRLSHEIEAHILQDDRVDRCAVDVSLGPDYILTVTVSGVLATTQGFKLIFALTDGGAALQEMTADV